MRWVNIFEFLHLPNGLTACCDKLFSFLELADRIAETLTDSFQQTTLRTISKFFHLSYEKLALLLDQRGVLRPYFIRQNSQLSILFLFFSIFFIVQNTYCDSAAVDGNEFSCVSTFIFLIYNFLNCTKEYKYHPYTYI